jgi:uncharacterized membrane protein YeaQ/YmgE (transglycosylase-associated protein family)
VGLGWDPRLKALSTPYNSPDGRPRRGPAHLAHPDEGLGRRTAGGSLASRLLLLAAEVLHMTITLPGLIILIVIAAVCGALGRAIAGEVRGGFIVSMVLGFVGALVGPWIAHQLKLAEPFMLHVSGQSFPILWSIIGAAVFVAIIHLISRR